MIMFSNPDSEICREMEEEYRAFQVFCKDEVLFHTVDAKNVEIYTDESLSDQPYFKVFKNGKVIDFTEPT